MALNSNVTHTEEKAPSNCLIITCSGDPRKLCYESEHHKKLDSAGDRMTAYLRLWVEAGKNSVTPSPMISSESDRFGLLRVPQA